VRILISPLLWIWVLAGCAVGRRHAPDATLEKVFFEHEAEFESLRAELQSDPKLMMIGPKDVMYGGALLEVSPNDSTNLASVGLTQSVLTNYQRKIRELGLRGGVFKSDRDIEFRVEPGGILNGDSYKGYQFMVSTPNHIRSSLDDYRISDSDRDRSGNWSVYKHLKGHWYLYLFVSR